MRMSARPATAPRISDPGLLLRREQAAGLDDQVDMRMPGRNVLRQVPHLHEGAVVQLEASVGAEHRDALFQRIERFALHLHERIDLRGEFETFAHVIEQIGHAALRIGIDDDAQGAAVGQVPPGFLLLDGAVAGEEIRFPCTEIGLLRKLARGAQTVEDFAVRRARGEEAAIESPQALIGGIAEDELLPASKIATAVGNWSRVRTCASICRCRSARTLRAPTRRPRCPRCRRRSGARSRRARRATCDDRRDAGGISRAGFALTARFLARRLACARSWRRRSRTRAAFTFSRAGVLAAGRVPLGMGDVLERPHRDHRRDRRGVRAVRVGCSCPTASAGDHGARDRCGTSSRSPP